MRQILLILIIVIASLGCGKPDQPPLTKLEWEFMDSLQQNRKYSVERSIDIMLLGRFYKEGDRGSYALSIKLHCDTLLYLSDSKASREAASIARALYDRVLKRDYKYNELMIRYECDTFSSVYKVKLFNFNTDSLY